ncbi:MAG: DUF1302 family protein, partial [Thermodesulfobacteriota bacterium]|nr:DUF1302 family protein [Thermodesulfobacteriota bacterium]
PIRNALCAFSVLLCALIFTSTFSFALEDTTVDEVVSGFEHKEPESSESDLHEILGGFEEGMDESENSEIDDDILEGFDGEDEEVDTESPEDELKPSFLSLDGHFKLGSSLNIGHDSPEMGETDWRGLSRLCGELQLDSKAKCAGSWQAFVSGKVSYDFAYTIKGRDEFTDEVLDNYEKEFELREAYILGSLLENLDIKFGRQIVVWGKSDNIRVTDVLNPLDMREPGLTDIEDLRLPVAMTRLDYYFGDWSLTGIALHEIRFNKNPEYGSDFYPAKIPPPHEDKPGHGGDNTEYAIAISGVFTGWDIALYWADIYHDMSHVEIVSFGPPPQLEMKHARLTMYGVAFNTAMGNWLLKAEAAYFDGIKFYNTPTRTYSRVDTLAGIEYSGFDDTTISVEIVNRHIHNFDTFLKQPLDEACEDEFQSVVRLTRDFLNETLTLTILASTFGPTGQDGALQRISMEYDVTDALKVNGGVVLYHSGDLPELRNIGDNDRLFFEITYSF